MLLNNNNNNKSSSKADDGVAHPAPLYRRDALFGTDDAERSDRHGHRDAEALHRRDERQRGQRESCAVEDGVQYRRPQQADEKAWPAVPWKVGLEGGGHLPQVHAERHDGDAGQRDHQTNVHRLHIASWASRARTAVGGARTGRWPPRHRSGARDPTRATD